MELESGQSIQRWRGLSSEEKPGRAIDTLDEDNAYPLPIPVGSVLTEIDTGQKFYWDGGWPWKIQAQTIDEMFFELMQVNLQMLQEMRAIKRATAIQANGAFSANLNTD